MMVVTIVFFVLTLGGETIKHINQQSGAHCELDRRSQNNQNATEKTFIIRGDPDQIETAKRIISDKVQMPLNFVTVGNPNNLPTAYPGMAPQGYNPQGWGVPGYQQQWGAPAPAQGSDASAQNGAPGVQMGQTGTQPDYSLQWAEYYRSLGMIREAEMIEQQAKNKTMAGAPTAPMQPAPATQSAAVPQQPATTSSSAQPDYSAQWAEYYRSLGKHKEAEAIEAQMKAKNQASAQQVQTASMAGTPAQGGAASAYQPYAAYQAPGGYYGTQAPGAAQQGVPPQGQYGFPNYGYGSATQSGGQEN
ncbi:K Homology domain containing protein [Oryctes borbonicus]|uniref:K Homology domain containing protein n=1 Tax=Oryctes borbonicus TaxID=1629725 RepID=A0A0T6B3Y7_9SCAR|nr:K Homology domain containing protein [Oryctes borbonicus]